MSDPLSDRPSPSPPADRTIRWTSRLLAATFAVLLVIAVAGLVAEPRPSSAIAVALLLVLGGAALRYRSALGAIEEDRRAEAESVARILQGLSRSVSPDAIVAAIVDELATGTGADHVVVVRRAAETHALEATLVSRRPGVPNSTTMLPLADLDDQPDPNPAADPVAIPVAVPVAAATAAVGAEGAPARLVGTVVRFASQLGAPRPVTSAGPGVPEAASAPGRIAAERIARRVRTIYGLKHTLAAPLRDEHGLVGAIVVSRRTSEPWPASAQRILHGAALEASAALSRAVSHRHAQAQASTDALTGLPNRRYFDEFCGLLARRRRAGDAVGILMIDIDRFKRLNDTFGHAVGDEVLRAVAGAIARAVREDDVPARFGGEEFAVLLRNPGDGIAVEVGERVRRAVSALDLRRLGVGRVTVSVGVAVASAQDEPIADLVERADAALYEAKRRGRDRVIARR